MKKVISKKHLVELIELSRQYWVSARETGEPNERLLDDRRKPALDIESQTGVNEFSIIDLVDSIVRLDGFLPDAENEEIFNVLRIMGWRVLDEIQESESL